MLWVVRLFPSLVYFLFVVIVIGLLLESEFNDRR